RVLVPRLAETSIQLVAHQLPHAVAIWSDDHAPAHGRVIRQLRAQDQLVVPGAEIFCSGGERLFVSHAYSTKCKGSASADPFRFSRISPRGVSEAPPRWYLPDASRPRGSAPQGLAWYALFLARGHGPHHHLSGRDLILPDDDGTLGVHGGRRLQLLSDALM